MKPTGVAAQTAEHSLLGASLLALVALIMALVITTPAHAAGTMSGAEKLRRLDIMLMVTGLRCRATPDNFTADYGMFTSSHLRELNDANAELKADFAQSFGPGGAQRALDRLSTVMANGYGQGHPWLSCKELKMVARNLAEVRGEAPLVAAADQLLESGGASTLAYARRR